MDYWDECIRVSFEECDIKATEEQIKYVVDAVKGSHENYGMAHGYDMISNPIVTREKQELRDLKKKIDEHERWVLSTKPCVECIQTGVVLDGWGRDQRCDCCDGKGRI